MIYDRAILMVWLSDWSQTDDALTYSGQFEHLDLENKTLNHAASQTNAAQAFHITNCTLNNFKPAGVTVTLEDVWIRYVMISDT